MNLVFFDGTCGLCDQVVTFLLTQDKQEKFLFAPLQGVTAAKHLKNMPPEIRQADSLILIENFQSTDPKIYLYGKGALRIAWILGGKWAFVGWLSFLPGWMYNWAYRLVARNRHRIFKGVCKLPNPADQASRFLP